MLMVSNETILAAYGKGFGVDAVSRMLGVPVDRVERVCGAGVAGEDESVCVSEYGEFSMQALENVGNEILYKLACDVASNLGAYKPNEALAIARESLDRTKGKAAQMVDARLDVRNTYALDDADRDIIAMYYETLRIGNEDTKRNVSNVGALPAIDMENQGGGEDTP